MTRSREETGNTGDTGDTGNLSGAGDRDGFFRFPSTPHLAWLSEASVRGDKILDEEGARSLLATDVVIEEKIDGANVGFSVGDTGELRAQNRGQYLTLPYSGQFSRLNGWLEPKKDDLVREIGEGTMLFGEWCAARHTVPYTRLPDWFLLFDVFDRAERRFWSVERRDALASRLDLHTVPVLHRGRFSLQSIFDMLDRAGSEFGSEGAEGLVIRADDSEGWCRSKAKIVNPKFVESISGHWMRGKPLEWNRVLYG